MARGSSRHHRHHPWRRGPLPRRGSESGLGCSCLLVLPTQSIVRWLKNACSTAVTSYSWCTVAAERSAISNDIEAALLHAEARNHVDVSCIYLDGALRPTPRPEGANRTAPPPGRHRRLKRGLFFCDHQKTFASSEPDLKNALGRTSFTCSQLGQSLGQLSRWKGCRSCVYLMPPSVASCISCHRPQRPVSERRAVSCRWAPPLSSSRSAELRCGERPTAFSRLPISLSGARFASRS